MISINNLECIYLTVKLKKKIFSDCNKRREFSKMVIFIQLNCFMRFDNFMAILIYNTTISSPDF